MDYETHPSRRRIVRQVKAVLVEDTILIGVAHCIEASFVLANALEEGNHGSVACLPLIRAYITRSNTYTHTHIYIYIQLQLTFTSLG